jgi:hypothetical protein
MQGHLPTPPQPQLPIGLSPIIGYAATREPSPLETRAPGEPDWLDADIYDEEWGPGHSRAFRVVAVVICASLVLGGLSTVLDLILSPH